jgi:dTDP-4-amino-4,6-dideoxygalactose transaminase
MNELKAKAIGTQVHYIPVHLQPYYQEHFKFKKGDYPKAERYYRQCLSIPLYPKMTDDDVQRVIDAILELF